MTGRTDGGKTPGIPRATQYPTLPLYGSASSDPLNSELRNKMIPRGATLVVDRVHLLDVSTTNSAGGA